MRYTSIRNNCLIQFISSKDWIFEREKGRNYIFPRFSQQPNGKPIKKKKREKKEKKRGDLKSEERGISEGYESFLILETAKTPQQKPGNFTTSQNTQQMSKKLQFLKGLNAENDFYYKSERQDYLVYARERERDEGN